MKKFYSGTFKVCFVFGKKILEIIFLKNNKNIIRILPFLFLFQFINTGKSFSQKLLLSYSYFNLTRNNGGGNLEHGDTIEIHALAQVNATVKSFYYIDTIPVGTQYISNSMKIMTNEGIIFSGGGPFTDATNDDRGVFNILANAIRINIGSGYSNAQTGAGFGSTTGGGTVTPGNIPKFYGNTLFIVAYKLVVTANYGDTIRPTGNYYFDTSGVGTKTSFRFNYPGIKILQNLGLCSNALSASFSAESSFGSGTTQNRAASANVPGYIKVNMGANAPQDNYFAIANNTSANGSTNNAGPYAPTANANRVFGGYWDIIGDHTNAANTATGNLPVAPGTTGGYMLVVNAAYTTGEAYRDTIKNVCPNTYYEFSAWVRNLCGVCGIDSNSNATYTPGVLPNLAFAINDIDYYTSGNIKHDTTWHKYGFLYLTGPTETQFRITIKNNAAGGGGNDWVLDDIDLATCYPNLTNSPKDTATACANSSISLSDTVKSYFNNYNNYCWQKSSDGINWSSTGVCSSKVPVLVNGQWVYVVDTTFTTVAADSGKYYRLVVATTSTNLSNSLCSVGNNQKIFLKVYNVNCTLLQASILNFSGNIIDDKSNLRWTSQNEANLKEYIVEKSLDGIHFTPIGTVAGQNELNGAGYSFTDPNSISSVAYYRLNCVGLSNNQQNYSKIIVLINKNAQFIISPVNPFNSNIKMNIFVPEDGSAVFNLYDLYGKIVSKQNIQLTKGSNQVTVDNLEGLSSGVYILRSQFKNAILQNKLIKIY